MRAGTVTATPHSGGAGGGAGMAGYGGSGGQVNTDGSTTAGADGVAGMFVIDLVSPESILR